MKKLECRTHGVKVTVENNQRDYQTPPGSWGGLDQCSLFTLKDLRAGTYGKCVVETVE